MSAMLYQTYKPAPALQPFVGWYYIMEYEGAGDSSLSIYVPANGYAALVLSFRDRLTWFAEARPEERLPEHFVTGPATQGGTLRLNGRHSVLGVVLKGAGFLRLFGCSAIEVVNKRIPLEFMLGPVTEPLSQQIQEAEGPVGKIAVMETFLLGQLNEYPLEVDWTDQAAGIILQKRGMINMDALAAQLNVCPRHLRRRFKERTGLSPKLFARLKRFNYTNLLLAQDPDLDWQDLIFQAGFYDQAHFIKDFTHFAGARPSEVLRQHYVPRDRLHAGS